MTVDVEAAPVSPPAAGAESLPTLADAQALVARLPWAELSQFATWFPEYFADAWDDQIERDALAGRLDFLAEYADAELKAGRCTPL